MALRFQLLVAAVAAALSSAELLRVNEIQPLEDSSASADGGDFCSFLPQYMCGPKDTCIWSDATQQCLNLVTPAPTLPAHHFCLPLDKSICVQVAEFCTWDEPTQQCLDNE